MLLLRESIVVTLLEHGAFDAAATRLVSGLPCSSIRSACSRTPRLRLWSRGFYVLGDTRTPVALAIASMLLNIILLGRPRRTLGAEGAGARALDLCDRRVHALAAPAQPQVGGPTHLSTVGAVDLQDHHQHGDHGQLVWLLIEILVGLDFARDSWLTLVLCVSGGAVVYFALSLNHETGRSRAPDSARSNCRPRVHCADEARRERRQALIELTMFRR